MAVQAGGEGFRYEKYIGHDAEVILPAQAAGQPLAVIGAKAFLSCKEVETLVLPETLEIVEDWAFAHMKQLQEITFPVKKIKFGKKVFLGCENLKKVHLQGTAKSEGNAGMPFLLASMFRYFPEERLQNLELAGSMTGQSSWLADYDEALTAYLARPDDYDFEPAFIGWFDVEDVDDQKCRFVLQQQKTKIELVFQRLIYSEGLAETVRRNLAEYLLRDGKKAGEYNKQNSKHNKNSNRDLVLEMFCDEEKSFGQDISYYKIWAQIGGLDSECAGELMKKIPYEDPEIHTFLLEKQMEVCKGDFFAGLEL